MLKRTDLQIGLLDYAVKEWLIQEVKHHPLIKLKPLVDKLSDLYGFQEFYSKEGRPSYSPRVMIGIEILKTLTNSSYRKIIEECKVNVLFRYFIGLKLNEKVPDHSSCTRFRNRLGEEGFSELFSELISLCKELGLYGGDLRIVDATHITADISRIGKRELLRQGRKVIIREVKKINPERADELSSKYEGKKQKAKVSSEELKEDVKLTLDLIGEVSGKYGKKVDEKTVLVSEVLDGNPEGIVSFTDPDARGGYKTKYKPFQGYKAHIAVDANSGLVGTVKTTGGNENDGSKLKELVEKEYKKSRFKELSADAIYGSSENLEFLRNKGITPYIPSHRRAAQIDDFEYREDGLLCPEGHFTIRKIKNSGGELYYFSTKQCNGCRLKRFCVSPGEVRKKVFLSMMRKDKILFGKSKMERKEKYKKRWLVEQRFAEAKRWHGLGRAYFRGKWRVGIQVLSTFLVMNLKRMSKLIREADGLAPI